MGCIMNSVGNGEEKIMNYVTSLVGGEDDILREVRLQSNKHREEHGASCEVYPSSPAKGQFLELLITAVSASRVLEVGCGLGYTALRMARQLPAGGLVETVEKDPKHASLALKNFEKAGAENRIKVLEGHAESILPELQGPYDLVLEDAAYGNVPAYLGHLIRLTRLGGFLVTSNWFTLEPLILEEQSEWSPEVGRGMEAYGLRLFQDERLRSVLVPYVWWGISVKVSE